jgi:uncharacterized protein with PIN domain
MEKSKMKTANKIITITFLVMIFGTNSTFAQEHNHSHKQNDKEHQKMVDAKKYDKNDDGSVYQCSMNPDQISDEPGECSKCEMKLSQVSVDDANKNLKKMSMKSHDKMMKDGKHKMDHDKMMKDGEHKMKNSMVHEGIIDVNAIDKNGDKKIFQDQMDWNVLSDKPGTCPLCEMKLKEVSIYEAKVKLIENGFKVK